MSPPPSNERVRILIVDDTRAVHDDLKKVLGRLRVPALASMGALLGGKLPPSNGAAHTEFVIDSAYQGEDAPKLAERARATGEPYAIAFVDMSMPPGWNGFQTARALLEQDPEIHVVLCTASADFTWQDVASELGRSERVLVLKKPYDPIEALQIAHSLGETWHRTRRERAHLEELEAQNAKLAAEVVRRRGMEDQLRFDALHDTLTRLPNRALLLERIEQCLRRKRREEGYHFALVFFDLDDFKIINDTFGHRNGDQLLIEVSNRILACVRGTDCTARVLQGTAARLGGDEFVVLLDGIDTPDGAGEVTQRILNAIARPVTLDGGEVRPSASAGIAIGSERHCSADDLLRDADCALYEAKRSGKQRMSIFDERQHQELISKLRMESELRRAIDEQQLFLHYQPIVDLHDERIHGFEALVRWDHPVHGRLPPSAFLPLAEEKGLIGDLGLWVLREACRQTAIWRRQFPVHSDLTISVNFSGKELQDPSVLDTLDRVLAETGLRTADLNIELTETILLAAARPGCDALDRMRMRDMNLHMDDFGAGLSSLGFLSRLPIRALKLDRSFVRDLGSDSSLGSVLEGVLVMAHARNLKVIGEGIETPEQYALLRAAGCDCGQGFYFCPPVDAGAVEEMLRGRPKRKSS